MENGDSGYGNGSNQYRRSSTFASSSTGTRIGGITIKPIVLYVVVGLALIVVLYMLVNLLRTAGVMHFGVAAGALLLLANLRELLGKTYGNRNSTALLNCLIGGALVCAWLAEIVLGILWIPAVALLFVAAPLAIGRASVYSTYVQTARGAAKNLRRAASRWN